MPNSVTAYLVLPKASVILKRLSERAVESLGVNFGAVNMDLIITG